MSHRLSSWSALAWVMGITAVGAAETAPAYCPRSYAVHYPYDPRVAIWNPCFDREQEFGDEANQPASTVLVSSARVGHIERILGTPTDGVDVFGQRVAATEPEGALWVLTDRKKTRLLPPELVTEGTYPLDRFTTRFDPKDGSLVLFAFGFTGRCGGSEGEWSWRWDDGWTALGDPMKETTAALAPREPEKAFPELPGHNDYEWPQTKRLDGRGRPWIVGKSGAFLHDGTRWWRVEDAPSNLSSMAVQGNDRVWLSIAHGLYRLSLSPTLTPMAETPRVPLLDPKPPEAQEAGRRFPEVELSSAVIERISLPLPAGMPLTKAEFVVAGPRNTLHFVDGARIVALSKGVAKPYTNVPLASAPQPLAFAKGDGWLLSKSVLRRLNNLRGSTAKPTVFDPSALAMTDERGWVVSCRAADDNPVGMTWNGATWTSAPALPRACYRATTLVGRDEAWLVGGLRLTGSWPIGEGILVHAQGDHMEAIRIAEGALLSVAATPAGELYAGGYDGLLLRRQGAEHHVFRVAGDPWIVALASHGDRVAVAGERLVGIIEDGRLRRLPKRQLPAGTWTSVAFDSNGALWVVGKAGILRITLPES